MSFHTNLLQEQKVGRMEVNSKHLRGHHLPCLSGSSQTPLITTNENESESSTFVSTQSLAFSSPTNRQKLASCNSPQLRSASIISGPATSIFFPPLPSRSKQQSNSKSNVLLELGTGADNICPSPYVADVNMNAEHECDRGHAQNTTMSPNFVRFSTPESSPSKISSPLIMPAKSFHGPFSESPHLITQPPHAAKPTDVMKTNDSANNTVCWSQQDESYHLYHEPIDLEEQDLNRALPITPNKFTTENSSGQKTHDVEHSNNCSSSQARTRTTNTNASVNSNVKDWSFLAPSEPAKKSPTVTGSGGTGSSTNRLPPFNERVGIDRRNDVSADIYFCYVTLKSNERANHRSRSYHGPKNSSHNEAQQALCTKDVIKNLSSSSIADLPNSPSTKALSMMPMHFRDHCLRELIETESNYVHALEMMITCFARPLEHLLKRDENQLIFGHIKYFHGIHSAFQADLVKAALRSYNRDTPSLSIPLRNSFNSSPSVNQRNGQTSSNPATPTAMSGIAQRVSPLLSPAIKDLPELPGSNKNYPKISTCFLNIKDKFLKYGEYCASLSKAQALLDELTTRNETIAAHLDRCQQDANEGKFKLRDLLSLPMQRILKYHLLLAQLIKNTSATNDDYQGLKKAHEAMVDLGQYINEVKRDSEAIQIINDIEQSIIGLNMPANTQLTDYGRLVTDGFLRVRVPQDCRAKSCHDAKLKLPHDAKLKQKRYVFVFDKVILMCKISGVRGYHYKEALVLSEFEIDTISLPVSSDTGSKHATKDKWNFNFNLVRPSDKTTYSFYAKTSELKTKWIEAIQKAIDNIRPPACRNKETNHEFLMHTFEKASSCDHCGKLLLGLYYQGYRCRNCFSSAHKKCLSLIRPCGPCLPPRPGNTLSHPRTRCEEPPSPSVRSNCSDESRNVFIHFPSSNSSSTQCVDAIMKNEYSNIESENDPTFPSRDGSKSSQSLAAHRPISSMINVSQQNSTNHLLQQKLLLRGSSSTPSICQGSTLRARALSNFETNQDDDNLRIHEGDMVQVYRSSMKPVIGAPNGIEDSMAQLKLGLGENLPENNDGSSWWLGKNMRTGQEGKFPSSIVEILPDQPWGPNKSDSQIQNIPPIETDLMNGEMKNGYVNFILNDYPWFHGRMERDKAQALLEKMPHGTFLVRVSPKHKGSYVISLNYNSQVKHMRIYVSKDNQLYLSQNRYFKSVIELVSWYERNSLVESFHMLDARLAFPYSAM